MTRCPRRGERARAVPRTEACSVAGTAMRSGRAAAAARRPASARLFASVAPLVNTISSGCASSAAATSSRAASSRARARVPGVVDARRVAEAARRALRARRRAPRVEAAPPRRSRRRSSHHPSLRNAFTRWRSSSSSAARDRRSAPWRRGEVVELVLELLDVVEQDRDRARHRIGQIAVVEVDELEPAGRGHAVARGRRARECRRRSSPAAPGGSRPSPRRCGFARPIVTGPSTVAPVVIDDVVLDRRVALALVEARAAEA